MQQNWQAEFTTLRTRRQQLTRQLESFDQKADLMTLPSAQARARETALQELEEIDSRAERLTARLRQANFARAR